MTYLHSSAAVSPRARLGKGVHVGPFVTIEEDVEIGDECRIAGRATIKRGTRLGPRNEISEGAVLGGRPQHLRVGSDVGRLIVGARNIIRENVTIHAALQPDGSTVVGDGNLIMVGAHIAHDCRIGSHTIMANNVMLAGHIEVADYAYLSGAVGVHQFCRIGSHAMVGGQAHIKKDVPPFVTVDGFSSCIVGLNLVGLRRRGFEPGQIQQLKKAYRLIYRSGLSWNEMLDQLRARFTAGPATAFSEFFAAAEGKRGFVTERRTPRAAVLPLDAGPAREPSTSGTPTSADRPAQTEPQRRAA